MRHRKGKAIIIGARGYQRSTSELQVNCVLWNQLNEIKNIRDFDMVILNLLPLINEKEKIDWNLFRQKLNFPMSLDILKNEGSILVIGDPRFYIKFINEEGTAEEPFLEWTGLNFIWDSAPGDTKTFTDDLNHRIYKEYISHLKAWEYSLRRVNVDQEVMGKYFCSEWLRREKTEIGLDEDWFVKNRYGAGLVFTLNLTLFCYKKDHHFSTTYKHNLKKYGPIIFLPKIGVSEDETITIVLRDICGIETELPEPEWLSKHEAPGQDKIDEEINQIKSDIKNLSEGLKKAEQKRNSIRTCLKLLYEREYALEPAVRDILRELGAQVEDPDESNKEDGWITVNVKGKTYEGVLEIKSTRTEQFGEGGIRQLLDWIYRGVQNRQKTYKGIFIGNNSVDMPLNERPFAFSDSWLQSIRLHKIVAMKTEDLYVIYILNNKGILDLDEFWEKVFTTDGILEMETYHKLYSQKDDSKE